ncbi:hypothetical protein CH293_27420 [Rhodococcus sp. 14-2470-1b]|uniref:hypothetical protein n=1 Tax=Rhodococcus sp. 14-2470-1b TaxID=2023149 RepID=UPI000B9BC646|nr:hypothetical protein [Rhodococcus sp. 14-2470-1b]OZF41813.1 hypothetical protein CH293_27420 [Rhodococcus sp. 14-2470-1b]
MSTQGEEYTNHIKAALEAEYKRRDDLNARSASVITSAGGLVTLTVAVLAVFLGKDYLLSGGERGWMIFAFILFLVCAILGVFAGLSWKYKVADGASLNEMTDTHWCDSEDDARKAVAKTNTKSVVSLRDGNNWKSRFLLAATISQVLAIAGLAISALLALT